MMPLSLHSGKALLFSRPISIPTTMSKPKPEVTAYLKTWCGWSEGVRAIMRKYDLQYEEKDIIKNPAFRWEMEQKTGQPMSPCIIVNGVILADVSGDELEQYMLSKELVEPVDREADAPTDSSCSPEIHAMQAAAEASAAPIRFIQ